MARADDTLPHQIAIRLSDDDLSRLDSLTARIPIASRNAVARAALRLGLDALEANPARIVEAPPPRRGRKPTRSRS
jgi:predicted transcriptional regulator